VPSGLLTQFELVVRSHKLFEHLQPRCYAPGIIGVSDIQLLEGMADLAPKIPDFPGKDPDMMKLIAGWRWAATKNGEASLQLFLLRRGFPLPLSNHILTNAHKVIQILAATNAAAEHRRHRAPIRRTRCRRNVRCASRAGRCGAGGTCRRRRDGRPAAATVGPAQQRAVDHFLDRVDRRRGPSVRAVEDSQ